MLKCIFTHWTFVELPPLKAVPLGTSGSGRMHIFDGGQVG